MENGHLNLTDQEPTTDHAKIRERIRKIRELGPSTRQQSRGSVQLNEQMYMLGQSFDMTSVPLSKLYQMRRDPMIGFALQFVKVPLVRAQWKIECEDRQIAAFVDYALRKIYARFILQYLNCLDFGWQAIVKRFQLEQPDVKYKDENGDLQPVWDEGPVQAVTWRPFSTVPPQDVEPLWTPSGDFDGFQFSIERAQSQGFPGSATSESKHKVPVEHALWATNERDSELGSIYGYPRIGYAYRYWWTYWYNWALADRHFEKDADPPMIVRFPQGSEDENTDYRDLALMIGEDSRSGATVAIPSEVHTSEVDGRPSGVPLWDMGPVEYTPGSFDAFNKRFEYLDVQKLRAIMVPEQAFLEGKGGTSSRNVAGELGDRFEESQAVLMAEIDDHINRYLIPQLVVANFPEFEGPCRKITRGFGSEDIEFAKQIIQLIGQSDANKLPVDIREILADNGIKVLTPDEENAQFEKAVERQQKMQMPVLGETEGGGAAAETSTPGGGPPATRDATSTGFDAALPRNPLLLAESAFMRALPPSAHYQDDEIILLAAQLHKAWTSYYREAYDAAAEHVRTQNFDEETNGPKAIAERLLQGFAKIPDELGERTRNLLHRIMIRAGVVELGKNDLDLAEWTPDRQDVADWIDGHAGTLVTGVHDTVLEELRIFLAAEVRSGTLDQDEIAERLRTHFSDWPDWKATRLVRTEVRDAYNVATLLAAKTAGVTRVQASDASDGSDNSTDEECRRRNGRIFALDQALDIFDHPNGTLYWKLLKATNLSVEYVPVIPEAPTALGFYDGETETIYLREDISEEAEREYLLLMGEKL